MSYDAVAASGSRYRVGDVQYDEKGKAFVNMSDGSRVYLSPYAQPGVSLEQAQASKPQGGGFLHGGAEWNTETGEWDTPFAWDKLLNYGVGAGIGLGGANALGAFGGGGGGAAASMPALSSPASVLPSGGGGMIGAGGAMPALSSPASVLPVGQGGIIGPPPTFSPGHGLPLANTAPPAASKSVLDRLLGLGLPIGVMAAGRAMAPGGAEPPPEIQELLNLQKNRMMQQNPLFEAVTRLAMSRLPTNMQMPIPGQGER